MNFEEYQDYLKERVAYWEKCEQENLKDKMQRCAYIAKSIKDSYVDALKKSEEIKF